MSIDLLIVFAFIVYSITVGWHHRRTASRNLEEYFLAGRSLKGWKAGFSMAATQYAADTPLLVTGLVATAGVFALWRLWVYGIAFLLMGFVLSSSWRRARVLTDAELTELRYGGKAAFGLRILKALHLGTLINCTVLAMVLIAAARVAEPFLLWHEWIPGLIQALAPAMERMGFLMTALPANHPEVWLYSANNCVSIGAIVAFTWLYSTTGGLRSVVATDIVQLSIMLIGTAAYAIIVLMHLGGPAQLSVQLSSLYGAESARQLLSFGPLHWDDGVLLFCTVLAIQWFAQINADGTGYLAQRAMACSSDKEAKIAAVVFTFIQVLLRSLLWLPIILGLLVLYPADALPAFGHAPEAFRVAREASFAHGIRDLLPVGIRGLMLTAMLAALASTVDTHLNWGASYWTNDLYKRGLMEKMVKRNPGPKELVWVARISSVGILLIALVIGVNLSSIQSAWHLSLLFGSGLGVVLILRWLWYRINVYSELMATMVSFTAAPILLFVFPEMREGLRLVWMTGISTLAVLAVTLLTRPESQETLNAFYTHVRPYGFWDPVAKRLGDDPAKPRRALARAALATALASMSCFSLLIGLGTLLIQAPTGIALFFPIGLALLGLVLIPWWVKYGLNA